MFGTWGFVATILIAFFIPTGHSQDACIPQSNKCIFYRDCLEAKIPCGPKGYALGYGFKYCNAFMKHYSSFSDVGKQWVSATCFCLQNVLRPIVNGDRPQTCTAIKKFAMSSHVDCYTNTKPSICDIPKTDIPTLFVIIVKELMRPESWPTIMEVVKKCMNKEIYSKWYM
ncbi:hypothetical protein HA402_008817 [Bradysia odoriphaga]|nr:hypothetical protein HA402_008817 [Bradysia odoriphaga]